MRVIGSTVQAFLVHLPTRQVAMVQRADTGRWALPGGGVEDMDVIACGEGSAQILALQREILEELGLTSEVYELQHRAKSDYIFSQNAEMGHNVTVILAFCDSPTLPILRPQEPKPGEDKEILAAEWWPLAELSALTSTRPMVSTHLARVQHFARVMKSVC